MIYLSFSVPVVPIDGLYGGKFILTIAVQVIQSILILFFAGFDHTDKHTI